MIEMTYVDSSNIEAVGYDPSTNEMHIRFLKTGLYVYHNVPQDVFYQLMNADSKGSYFNRNIKPFFTSVERR